MRGGELVFELQQRLLLRRLEAEDKAGVLPEGGRRGRSCMAGHWGLGSDTGWSCPATFAIKIKVYYL